MKWTKLIWLLYFLFGLNDFNSIYSQIYPQASKKQFPEIYDSLFQIGREKDFDSLIFYKTLLPRVYPSASRISFPITYDSLKKIGKINTFDSLIYVRQKLKPIKNRKERRRLFYSMLTNDNVYLRMNSSEVGLILEKPLNYEKRRMIQYSFSHRFYNTMDFLGIIPEIMSSNLKSCRQNQKRGFNFRTEIIQYKNTHLFHFSGFAFETGYYWTPRETELREYYTWDSDPIPFYKIHHLYSLRLGAQLTMGWIGETIGIKMYLGGRLQYYDLKYEMSRGNYYVRPTGAVIRETGIRISPVIRLFFTFKLNK